MGLALALTPDREREDVHLLLPARGHLALAELLEGEARELVGAQRLGLLGEGEEAVGLRDAEGRLVAQQPREQVARDVEDLG